MQKPKVLVCSEFSQLASGYAVYTKELMTGLHNRGIEVAELASFCRPSDPRISNCPWKVYPVQPDPDDAKGNEIYNSSHYNAFGKHMFEDICLHFKPSHILEPRDVWNFCHEFTSPLRPYYAYIIMPAIDSDVQHKVWLELYSKADGVMGYTDWAIELLRNKGLTNLYYTVTPVPSQEFHPLENKKELKKALGLGDIRIIGTVMRNQGRKLFPQLFRAFRRYLDISGRNDTYLYCHTSYPDTWELDELLIEHNIGHRVLFTYQCAKCGFVETSFFKGPIGACINCGDKSGSRIPNTVVPITQFTLNQIYNLFDLYVQYASLEGLGLPLTEACACSIPVMAVNYSGQAEACSKAGGFLIDVKDYYIEPGTCRRFAIPDEDHFISLLDKFFTMPEENRRRIGDLGRIMYGLRSNDTLTDSWIRAIANTQPKLAWDAPARNYNLPADYPKGLNSAQFARWIILAVLQEPSLVGDYMEARMVRDLETGFGLGGQDNKFYIEATGLQGQKYQPFNQEICFKHCRDSLLAEKIHWENRRCNNA